MRQWAAAVEPPSTSPARARHLRYWLRAIVPAVAAAIGLALGFA